MPAERRSRKDSQGFTIPEIPSHKRGDTGAIRHQRLSSTPRSLRKTETPRSTPRQLKPYARPLERPQKPKKEGWSLSDFFSGLTRPISELIFGRKQQQPQPQTIAEQPRFVQPVEFPLHREIQEILFKPVVEQEELEEPRQARTVSPFKIADAFDEPQFTFKKPPEPPQDKREREEEVPMPTWKRTRYHLKVFEEAPEESEVFTLPEVKVTPIVKDAAVGTEDMPRNPIGLLDDKPSSPKREKFKFKLPAKKEKTTEVQTSPVKPLDTPREEAEQPKLSFGSIAPIDKPLERESKQQDVSSSGFAFKLDEQKKQDSKPPLDTGKQPFAFNGGTSTTSESSKSLFSFGQAASGESQKPAFSFGAPVPKETDSSSSVTTEKVSFASSATTLKSAEISSGTSSAQTAKPLVSFGTPATSSTPTFGSQTNVSVPMFAKSESTTEAAISTATEITQAEPQIPETPKPIQSGFNFASVSKPEESTETPMTFGTPPQQSGFSFGGSSSQPMTSNDSTSTVAVNSAGMSAGGSAFSFGSQPPVTKPATTSGFTFGAPVVTPKPVTTPVVSTTSGGFTFGQATKPEETKSASSGLVFGQPPKAPDRNGDFSFGQALKQAESSQPGFSSGEAKPSGSASQFGSVTSQPAPSSQAASGTFTFGGKPSFSFDQSKQPGAITSTFSFGSTNVSKPPEQPSYGAPVSSGFQFGSMPTQKNQPQPFGLGITSQPQQSFGLGQTSGPSTSGFIFSQPQSQQQQFGQTENKPPSQFQFGQTPQQGGFQFNSHQPQQAQGFQQPTLPSFNFNQQPQAAAQSSQFSFNSPAPQAAQGGMFAFGNNSNPSLNNSAVNSPAVNSPNMFSIGSGPPAGRKIAQPKSRRGGRR